MMAKILILRVYYTLWWWSRAHSIHSPIVLSIFICFLYTAEVDRQGSDPMMSIVTPKEQYGNSYTFTTPTDGYNRAYRLVSNFYTATLFFFYCYTEKIGTVSTVNLSEGKNNCNEMIENHALWYIPWPVYIQVFLCREGGVVPYSCSIFHVK